MTDHDAFAERGRALEEDYFRKKDRELVEKLRQSAAAQQARDGIGKSTGLQDPALISALQELGFTADTVGLLPLVPVVQMAWAEGGVTKAERTAISHLARSRGVAEGTEADRQLTAWLDERPSDTVFVGARRLIRAMLDSGSGSTAGMSEDDIVKFCEEIAASSGGMFGIGRVSAEERALLTSIAADLRSRRG